MCDRGRLCKDQCFDVGFLLSGWGGGRRRKIQRPDGPDAAGDGTLTRGAGSGSTAWMYGSWPGLSLKEVVVSNSAAVNGWASREFDRKGLCKSKPDDRNKP